MKRDEARRSERRGKRQGEAKRERGFKGKSFKLRERKKNAFLLIPDKYVGKSGGECRPLSSVEWICKTLLVIEYLSVR